MRQLASINRLANSHSLMNDFLSEFFNDEFKPMTTVVRKPAANIYQTETGFGIDILLPGYAKEEISVDIDGRHLTVKSLDADTEKQTVENGKYIRRDFRKSAFEVKYILPRTADLEKLEAKFENGILLVSIPKAEQALPKKINVEIA